MDSVQVYNSFLPKIKAGKVHGINVDQSLMDGSNNLLSLTDPPADPKGLVYFQVDGPQLSVDPADIAGVYPAPGSTTSCDLFLPHIALTRRTLPWERIGPVKNVRFETAREVPWLALLLLTENLVSGGDLTPQRTAVGAIKGSDPMAYQRLTAQLNLSDATQVSAVVIRGDKLKAILGNPAPADQLTLLTRLCHGKKVTAANGDHFTAIVMANRLPDAANGKHMAALVSLEQRDDVLTRMNDATAATDMITLIVLHSWTFTPSAAADFEEVMQAISIQPNGGVLRFGNVTRKVTGRGQQGPLSGGFDAVLDKQGYLSGPIDHAAALETSKSITNLRWRGPLRPFSPPARSAAFALRADPAEFEDQGAKQLDYSHASAFELGRLLALGDSGLRQDLHEVHTYLNLPQKQFFDLPSIPQSLQSPFWGVDPESALQESLQDPWALPASFGAINSLLGTADTLVQSTAGDVSGIATQWGGGLQAALTTLQQVQVAAAQSGQASPIDINGVTEADLEAQFADVQNAGSIVAKVQTVGG
jgi:hypothetical protein